MRSAPGIARTTVGLAFLIFAQATWGAQSTTTDATAFLPHYCTTCHNERLKTAGLVLSTMDVEHVGADAAVWEKVVRKLRAGAMPPAGAPRPDESSIAAFISSLETSLDREAQAAPNPGRPGVHRLNRVEYGNAIRDLLGLEVDPKLLLPADNSSYGFDNIAAVLTSSPGLLEQYMLAAQKISRLALDSASAGPTTETYEFPFSLVQEDRASDDLPAGSRGVTVRHFFPADGEYVIRLSLQRRRATGGIRGIAKPQQLDVRLDGRRLSLFTFGGPKGPTSRAEIEKLLQIRVAVQAGLRTIGMGFYKHNGVMEGVGPSRLPAASGSMTEAVNTGSQYGKIVAGVDSVEVEGPFEATPTGDSPSRRRILVCGPSGPDDEIPCATRILAKLARRAYRRPVTDADLQPLLKFFKTGRSDGGFDQGILRALEAILVDPEFLFRIERDPANVAPGAAYQITDIDLASRLSFFFWSSIPDDELLDLAERGQLKDWRVLEQQVGRMVRDPRSQALIQNFFGQWLSFRTLDRAKPDVPAFPEFDENLRKAFLRETEMFLGYQLREDRGAMEVITANYTFVNERLARHYGIPNVYGSHFRRVTFGDDRRGGILGQGSILAVTSYPTRTSPVIRGKWVLSNLLGAPPPPPPPNVPPFPEADPKSQPMTVRARMEQHRRNPACATCHAKMDPLGFALENFDGIGQWRASESGVPIAPADRFADGTPFAGPGEFRRKLGTQYRDAILTTMVERLLIYGLGRGVEYYDMPAIRKIMRESARDDFRWSSVLLGIITSEPFQMRRAAS